MTIYYEDRRKTRKDGWQFWLTKGPNDKWIKIAGGRKKNGIEIYEKYSRQEPIGLIKLSDEVSKSEFIKWFKDTFKIGDPFEIKQTSNSNVYRARLNQVPAQFYQQEPIKQLWDKPYELWTYAKKAYQ